MEQEKFISIDELIQRAKALGIDLGKGNPRNRLRYYTKIGLLPPAQRKCFNNNSPTGAYPESVLEILYRIDQELKKGKSIQQIKKEFEKKEEKVTTFQTKKSNKKLALALVFLLFLFAIFTFRNQIQSTKMLSAMINLAYQKIAQQTLPLAQKLPSISIEPFLTINAQTLIKSSLKVQEFIKTGKFIISSGDFEGELSAKLTQNRTYTFPDESGEVCLSSGNCLRIFGQVQTPGGTSNKLAKFLEPNKIADSSILDKFSGISIVIDERGNVGIGTETPKTKFEVVGDSSFTGNSVFRGRVLVEGEIKATGDVCTEMRGGKCLSQLITAVFGGGGGIAGSGTPGYFPIFTATTRLGDSILRQSGNTLYLSGDFDLSGLLKATSFQLVTSSVPVGYVLTAISTSGLAAWMPPPSGTVPSGQFGFTLRHNGTEWIADSFLYNTGNFVGIGTTSNLATLAVAGSGYFEDSLKISSPTLAQFILQSGSNQFIFEIDSNYAKILSPKDLIIDSLTGRILATSSTFFALSFRASDATVRAPQEYVFREAIPIFKFPIPAETATTSFVLVSKAISTSTIISQQLPNTQRKIAFLINLADNIPKTSSSTWQITDLSGTPITSFQIQGQNMTSLDEGKPVLTNFFNLPNKDWVLKVSVPSGYKVRIFNILLLIFDQLS